MNIRTRFAPSPTGVLHIGSVRTALFNFLYARHHQGQFVLRIEDTDKDRSTPENVDAILEGMAWLGLVADEGPYFQSQRMRRYSEIIESFLGAGHAYHCYCTREELEELRAKQMRRGEKMRYDGRCRKRTSPREAVNPVVRFKNPLVGSIEVNDQVRGRVVFQNEELDDLIIARSDGLPTYNLTVIVDDLDMQISHVIRGDDHLNNTPRQLNMLQALGAEPPIYAHLPMILGEDGAKLSKRHGAVDIRQYKEDGFLPEALLNYLVRLGWSSGDKEIFSTKEMIDLFDLPGVNQSASSFNPEKLRWLNQQHIIGMSSEDIGNRLVPYLHQIGLDPADGPNPTSLANGFHERADTLLAMAVSARYCYEDALEIDTKSAKKHLRPVILEPLREARRKLAALVEWDEQIISTTIREIAELHGINLGKLGQPIRVAVTGGPVSPPIDVTLALIGRERSLNRLDHAIALIEKRANAQS